MSYKILLVDLETQGLDLERPRITEVGAVLYDVDGKKWNKLEGGSNLCYESDYPKQPKEIVELTNITDEMLINEGRPRRTVFENFLFPLMVKADFVMAHNKAFDETIITNTCRNIVMTMPLKEWICTKTNFPWPEKYTCKKLQHLAFEHRVFRDNPHIDPDKLHRALGDLEVMALLLAKYDINDVIAYAREPFIYLEADCLGNWVGKNGDGGIQTGIASSLGFRWNREKKVWYNNVKASKLDKLMDAVHKSASPFRVNIRENN